MRRLSVLRLGRELTELAILLCLNVLFRFGMLFHSDFNLVLSQLLRDDLRGRLPHEHACPWRQRVHGRPQPAAN